MSDQHVISSYSNTAESFMKFIRITEMVANLTKLLIANKTNSPFQYQRNCLGRIIENMVTDVRV